MSKKITRPSLKPARPMPHWSISSRAFASVSSVVGYVAAVLGVDDDLGAGPRLDLVDLRLRSDDRLRAEDAGLVVDRAVDLGLRERRPGRDAGRAIGARLRLG